MPYGGFDRVEGRYQEEQGIGEKLPAFYKIKILPARFDKGQ